MSTHEAAEFLGVTTFTIFRLIRRKSIKAKKFGSSWMIDRESVEAYKERNQGKTPNDPTRS